MADITVTGPDGSTFAFPEGTSGDAISGALSAHYNVSPAPPVAAPDKYTQAAQADYSKMKAAGYEPGYARRVMQGATFGGGDEIMAGLNTPFQMAARGTLNPVEGYKYAKALEDAQMQDARNSQGALGTAAEVAGSLGSAGGLGKAGFTLAKDGAGLISRSARMAGEGAAYGGVQGLLDGGNSVDDRLSGAAKGAALGGILGGAIPVASAAGKAVAAPILSNIRARVNPEGVAVSQIARGIGDSGKSVGNIVNDVSAAASEGQPMYTVADAMGFPGQRLLRMGVDAPGPGRTNAVNFLEQRQAWQGRRVANTLAEGFQTPQTAQQAGASMTAARDAAANAEYGAVRSSANPVDLSGTIAKIDETLRPGVNKIVNPASGIANDSVEASLARVRSLLTDGRSVATDFSVIQRARGDLADEIEKAVRSGANNKARLLMGVKSQLDASMEAASPGFKQANQNFARRSAAIDAIDTGRAAALRGRVEDTVPAFRAMPAGQQSAFRTGYVDPLIEQAQSGAFGVNKARPFTSDAFKTESQAVAPLATGNQMARKLAREQTMFETRAEATGGSKTSMNLADQEAQGVDPALLADIGHAGTGSPGAMMRIYSRITDKLNGYTPAVREQLVNMLLQRGSNPQIGTKIQAGLDKLRRNQAISSALMRGLTVGTATALPQRMAK